MWINSKFALRVDDMGMHAVCCGMNMWTAKMGAPTVNINGKKAYRKDDMGQSCGGMTKLIEGSADVIIGDGAGGGSAPSTGSSAAAIPRGQAGSGNAANSSGDGGGASSGDGGSDSGGNSENATGTDPAGSAQTDRERTQRAAADAPPQEPLPEEEPEHQIEIQLVNKKGEIQKNVRYHLELPDGTVKKGRSGNDGFIRVSGLKQAGDAKLSLPDLDGESGGSEDEE